MTEPPNETTDLELDLFGMLGILLDKWWVVVLVFSAIMAVAIATWAVRDDPKPVYEATTKLLIETPLSYPSVLNEVGTVLSPGLSVSTILELATATDLYQSIINQLELTNSEGQPISVATLSSLITTTVTADDTEVLSALITTIVQGDDPTIVVTISNVWADTFAEKNIEIVALQASGPVDLATGLYQDRLETLESAQSELFSFARTTGLERLDVIQIGETDLGTLRRKRANEAFMTKTASDDELLRLRQAFQDGRLEVPGDIPRVTLDLDFNAARTGYSNDMYAIKSKQTALVEELDRLAVFDEALLIEEPILTFERRISNESLLELLAGETLVANIDSIDGLVIHDQQENPRYTELRQDRLKSVAKVSVLEVSIAHLTIESERLLSDVERLRETIDSEDRALARYDLESERLIDLQVKQIALEASQFNAETDIQVSMLEADTALLIMLRELEITLGEDALRRSIDELIAETDRLSDDVRTAERATMTDESGSIRLVEAALMPPGPVLQPESRSLVQSLMIAVALGLVLGPVSAFGYHGFKIAWSRRVVRDTGR
jgi:hypothetical protein